MNTTTANPEESEALKALTALAHVHRLRVFKALVVAGPAGLTPGALALQLGASPSALSFHLKELVHSGLVACEQRGRNLIYTPHFAQMNAVLAYLTQHCCQGADCTLTEMAEPTSACKAC